jgi:hypothetical protein
MTKAQKQKEKQLNFLAGVIDCNYMIARLTEQGKTDEIEQWEQYRQDLIKLANKTN